MDEGLRARFKAAYPDVEVQPSSPPRTTAPTPMDVDRPTPSPSPFVEAETKASAAAADLTPPLTNRDITT